MTRRLTIFTDMDEVLVRLMDRWLERYNADYDDDKEMHDIFGWNMERWVRPECGKRIYDYLSLPNFFYDLKPYDGAIEMMEELHSKHDLYIMTATPVNAPMGFGDKLRWVERYLPFFGIDRVISCHNKQLIRGDVLLDDGAHNLRDFRGISCKMERPWNLGEDGCYDASVSDLEQFVSFIDDISSDSLTFLMYAEARSARLEKLNA